VKLSRLTIALYVALVFASGGVLGWFGHSLYFVSTVKSNPRPEDVRKNAMTELQNRLKLSAEQVSKINSIMDETRAKFHEVRERSRPEMDAIQKNQRDAVRAILTPEQLVEYEKLIKERDDRQKQDKGRGPGPGL
jgi:Spy/CpxP family protein refolding chaperone